MKRLIAGLLTAVVLTATACGGAGQNIEQGKSEAAEASAVTAEEPAAEEPAAEDPSAEEPAAEEPKEDGEAQQAAEDTIPYWTEDSAAAASIVSYVKAVTEESSERFIPEEERIAVFDFDGTLYGELYPTYFDTCLMMHRALHDDTYEAPAEIREYAKTLEDALLNFEPEPDSKLSSAQCSAEMFKGLTHEEYSAYIREYMKEPAYGFEGMTYAEGFYKPMTALVQYLSEHGFTVFISSGSERTIVRELIKGKLDQWVPSYRVIGSTFSLAATGQGDKDGRKYTYAPEDQVIMEGNLVVKNQKTNKVFSIVNEIGAAPVLVFGNSSGDLAMGQYAVQNGGQAYMLLCDDTERDYGKPDVAESFAKECADLGFTTVSMKNDFAAIYGDGAVKVVPQTAPEEASEGQTAEAAEEPAVEETADPAGNEAEEEALSPAA